VEKREGVFSTLGSMPAGSWWPYRVARRLPYDSTPVSYCRTWVKRVFILPIRSYTLLYARGHWQVRSTTLGADGCEKGLLRHEKAVYTSYTRFAVAVVTRSSQALAVLAVHNPRGASTEIPRKPLRRTRPYRVARRPSHTSESGAVVNRSYPFSVIAKESSMLYGPGVYKPCTPM
jgi:hypothetical protein